jgi:thiol-disulfide isomerase/thioredoxin
MGRAIPIHVVVAIGSILAMGSAWGQAPQSAPQSVMRSDVPAVIRAVEEWQTIPLEQAGLPQADVNEVLARTRTWLKSFEKLTSWEARYQTTFIQASPSPFRAETSFQMICDGRKWYSRQQSKSSNAGQSQPWEAACDGNTVRILWPDRKEAQVRKTGEPVGFGSAPTLPALFPQMPADPALRWGEGLPNLLDSLKGSRIRLLPVCIRVNDRPCYILERTVKEEYPVFRNRQEADQWDKEHEIQLASRDRSIPRSIVINPAAKPEDRTSSTITTLLAVDPKLGFAVVRWALRSEGRRPGLEMTVFPAQELIYQDFRRVDEGIQIPFQVEFTAYRANDEGRREVSQQSGLVLESFTAHPQYEPALFAPALATGHSVMDTVRGIVYTVGDPQSKIDRLLAGAQARDAFYTHLREGPAPALQASTWINSDPIDLAKYKGRPIILHFWSITCGPCMYEMPRVQAQYGNTLKSTDGPLFISIHEYAEGEDLEKVRQVVKDKGITFPVMVDAPDANRKYWGDTFYRYRIFSEPSEIHIDPDGRVGTVERELMSETNWWVRKVQDR